jgi:pimeloyl-ACP methyl ester carboxylesterase
VLYPERHPIPAPHPLPPYTSHALNAPDGASFDVWVLQPPSPRARLLIYHGYYANRYQVLGIARALRERGYETILVELRGHGSRPGPCTLGIREADEAGTVLQWARSRDPGRPLPVGLVGLSLGGHVACQVAACFPDEIRAIVLDSVYSRFLVVLKRSLKDQYHLPAFPWAYLTWWSLQCALRRRLSRIDPAALAPGLRQPLFAIQGGGDRRLGPALGHELYERWAGPKRRWFERSVAHVGMFTEHPQRYGARVAAFLDEVLECLT